MKPLSHATRWLKQNRADAFRLLGACVVVGLILLGTRQWWDEIEAALMRTHAAVFFVLLCVLPIGGVSIVLLYVVTGMRFGPGGGWLVVAAATAVHLLAMHLIARRFLRGPVERLLKRRGHQLPEVGQRNPWAVALLGSLVPGLPYFARNYLLALSGVPFRIYAAICWPVYVVRSGVALYLGGWAGDLTSGRMLFLGGFFAVKVGVCAAVVWHLRRARTKPGSRAGGHSHATSAKAA